MCQLTEAKISNTPGEGKSSIHSSRSCFLSSESVLFFVFCFFLIQQKQNPDCGALVSVVRLTYVVYVYIFILSVFSDHKSNMF